MKLTSGTNRSIEKLFESPNDLDAFIEESMDFAELPHVADINRGEIFQYQRELGLNLIENPIFSFYGHEKMLDELLEKAGQGDYLAFQTLAHLGATRIACDPDIPNGLRNFLFQLLRGQISPPARMKPTENRGLRGRDAIIHSAVERLVEKGFTFEKAYREVANFHLKRGKNPNSAGVVKAIHLKVRKRLSVTGHI